MCMKCGIIDKGSGFHTHKSTFCFEAWEFSCGDWPTVIKCQVQGMLELCLELDSTNKDLSILYGMLNLEAWNLIK